MRYFKISPCVYRSYNRAAISRLRLVGLARFKVQSVLEIFGSVDMLFLICFSTMCNSRRTNVMPRDGDRAYDRVWAKAIDLFMTWLDLFISLTGVWTRKKIHRKRHLSGLGVARSRVCREKIQSMRSGDWQIARNIFTSECDARQIDKYDVSCSTPPPPTQARVASLAYK